MEYQRNALIGYTGFVGKNILTQHHFEYLYNSKNIEEIQNNNFDLVVCAAAPGTKWLANKDPETDLRNIEKLIANLKTINTKKMVLISTIDVYAPINGINEDTLINKDVLQPYGRNRRILEEFIVSNFNSLIIRLPALFGNGLKKNPLYDLIKNSSISIAPTSKLQFYNLENLWIDIGKSLEINLTAINFATEPIAINDIAKKVLNIELENKIVELPQNYDMHTKYGNLWGNTKPYLYLKNEILADLKIFISKISIF